MSSKAKAKTQAKTPAAPAAARTPQHPVAVPEHEAEQPDIATQLAEASRLGHSFAALGVGGAEPPPIQPKLLVGPADDPYEREADRVASQVVSQLGTTGAPSDQPQDETAQSQPVVRREAAGTAPRATALAPSIEARINRARGSGQALPDGVRVPMEQAFGTDFRSVRVHLDAEATRLNAALQARAFTAGTDIFFRRGEYKAEEAEGKTLIAHELAHVIQQRAGVGKGGNGPGLASEGMLTTVQRLTAEGFDVEWKEETRGVWTIRGPEGFRLGPIRSIDKKIDDIRLLNAQESVWLRDWKPENRKRFRRMLRELEELTRKWLEGKEDKTDAGVLKVNELQKVVKEARDYASEQEDLVEEEDGYERRGMVDWRPISLEVRGAARSADAAAVKAILDNPDESVTEKIKDRKYRLDSDQLAELGYELRESWYGEVEEVERSSGRLLPVGGWRRSRIDAINDVLRENGDTAVVIRYDPDVRHRKGPGKGYR